MYNKGCAHLMTHMHTVTTHGLCGTFEMWTKEKVWVWVRAAYTLTTFQQWWCVQYTQRPGDPTSAHTYLHTYIQNACISSPLVINDDLCNWRSDQGIQQQHRAVCSQTWMRAHHEGHHIVLHMHVDVCMRVYVFMYVCIHSVHMWMRPHHNKPLHTACMPT